jgi:hypothetical protein
MNVYQAVRDALRWMGFPLLASRINADCFSIALTKDDNAVVFGEDVAFGGVFRYVPDRSHSLSNQLSAMSIDVA